MSTTIRVSEATRDRLAALARETGRPMTEVVAAALNALERRIFLDAVNARYAELRDDAAVWSDVTGERAVAEGAIRDHLE